MWSTLELLVLAPALAVFGDLTHFTWWGIALLVIYDFAATFHLSITPRVHHLALSASVVILIAVVGMSMISCTLLNNTYNTLGTAAYVGGNLALHYWPSFRLLTLAPQNHRSHHTWYDAASLIAAYCIFVQPEMVYGCSEIPVGVAGPLGVVAAALVECALCQSSHSNHRKPR